MKLNEFKDISGRNLTLNDVKNTKQLAKKLHISEDELNKFSDEELLSILKNLGYHDFNDTSKFDKHELEMGIQHELEHSKSKLVAQLVVCDHLSENPHYYSELKQIEND